MQAVTNTRYGSPEVLSLQERPRPELGPEQVLVEVRASVVTRGDLRLRAADFPGITALLGRLMLGVLGPRASVPGTMFAGRIVAVGAEVRRFAVGDDVFGSVMHGAHAEYLAISESDALAKMPARLDYAESAAVPYGAGTALTFLRELAQVQPGQKVLVVGASGGVGRFAIQLAKHLEAEVTAVASRHLDRLQALGADHVIDYTQHDYVVGAERYDVILDTSEHGRWSHARHALTPRGRYLSLHVTASMLAAMAWSALRPGPRAICGVSLADAKQLNELRRLVDSGALQPTIAARFPLSRIVDAHTCLEDSRPWGSVAVEVNLDQRSARTPASRGAHQPKV